MVRRSLNFRDQENIVDEDPVSLEVDRQALQERRGFRSYVVSLESRECWS